MHQRHAQRPPGEAQREILARPLDRSVLASASSTSRSAASSANSTPFVIAEP